MIARLKIALEQHVQPCGHAGGEYHMGGVVKVEKAAQLFTGVQQYHGSSAGCCIGGAVYIGSNVVYIIQHGLPNAGGLGV